jgi:hypothetical protein
MLSLDWKSCFTAQVGNKLGIKNTTVYTKACPPDNDDQKHFQKSLPKDGGGVAPTDIGPNPTSLDY